MGVPCAICQCHAHKLLGCGQQLGPDQESFVCNRCYNSLNLRDKSDIKKNQQNGIAGQINLLQKSSVPKCSKDNYQIKQWLDDLKMASRPHLSFKNSPIPPRAGFSECDKFVELMTAGFDICGEDGTRIIIKELGEEVLTEGIYTWVLPVTPGNKIYYVKNPQGEEYDGYTTALTYNGHVAGRKGWMKCNDKTIKGYTFHACVAKLMDVYSAGEFLVTGYSPEPHSLLGQITIDNNSGHYKPSGSSLDIAKEVFMESDVRTEVAPAEKTDIKIRPYVMEGGGHKRTRLKKQNKRKRKNTKKRAKTKKRKNTKKRGRLRK